MSNTTVTVDGSPVLNPFSWSAFLPPDVAAEVNVESFILAGVAGAFVWDILNNIREDYILVTRRSRLGLPIIIYVLSKLCTFAYVIVSAIFQTAPISNCFVSEKAVSVLFCLAVPLTSLLFFFRARAVFGRDPFAVAFFGVLWLGVLGGCLTTIPGIGGANIGPTPYCTTGVFKFYAVAAAITPLINDGIVFFAITWRLWRNTWARRTVKNGVRALVYGDYLPMFSKSLLQDGQIYFLTTVSTNLLTVAMAFATSVPNPYRTVFTIPNTALMNIMACRVYRRMLSAGSGDNQGSSHSNSHSHSHSNSTVPIVPLAPMGDFSARTKNQNAENLAVNFSTTVETMV